LHDGVYVEHPEGAVAFRSGKAPTIAELAGLVQRVG